MAILPQLFGRKKPPASVADASSVDTVESDARRQARLLVELANLDEDSGNLASALSRVRDAVRVDPGFARAHLNLGNVLCATGDVDGAIAATREALRIDDRYPEAHCNLGLLYDTAGEKASAEAHYRKALELRPHFSPAAVALAGMLESMGRASEAQEWLRQALARDPDYAGAAFNLSRLLQAEGNAAEAEHQLRRVVAIDPGYADAYCVLGNLCKDQQRTSEAIAWYLKALQVEKPGVSPESKALLARASREVGISFVDEDRWEEGAFHLRRAIELAPEWAETYVNLAFIELQQARPEVAVELYRTAVRLAPNVEYPRSYLLFALNMIDAISAKEVFDEHCHFGGWLEGMVEHRYRDHPNSRDESRILRVGYVSGDFRVHPVAQFVSPLLNDHDPRQVAVYCYNNTGKRDDLTDHLQHRFANTWRDITGLTDDEAGRLVNQDQIDILVDLSGHTGESRVSMFAQKPAPIQVTWLSYLNTSGLKTMDYRLVDRHTDPVGATDELNTERLVRLPDSQWAYWPLYETPVMRPNRATGVPQLIFGSFNQYAKIVDRNLELWARILARLPHAVLRIAAYPRGASEEPLRHRLAQAGIASGQVEIARRAPHMKYLQSYNDVDIALDSMPYNGATTTLDTLWMGIPVVGLRGDRSISRGTYSILKTLARDDLIAETADEYVELNIRLATDSEWRNELHRSLRDEMKRSPLTDISRFRENLEAAYRVMWREWCQSQDSSTSS